MAQKNEEYSFDKLAEQMRENSPVQKGDQEPARNRRGELSKVQTETPSRGAGRPKKKRALREKISKTTFFDIGTHQRIKQLGVYSSVEVKDLILVAVVDFLDRHCDENGKLSVEAEKLIERTLDRIYAEYGIM